MKLATALVLMMMVTLARAATEATPSAVDVDPALFTPDFFPIMNWDIPDVHAEEMLAGPNGLASQQDCCFTLCGFARPRDLLECERLGLKVIVAPDVPEFARWTKDWKNLSDEEIERRVRWMIEEAGDSPAVLGYFIMDEPGASQFEALGKAVAAVRKYAPGKLAYINLFPGYATIGAPNLSQLETASFTEYLERYVAEVRPQMISYDNYQVQYSRDMTVTRRVASYYSDLLEVRRVAAANGLPFWNIVSSNQIRPPTSVPSPANLRLQAYTTLAAGGRGLTWYTYYSRGYGYAPVDRQGDRTNVWYHLQAVNREVGVLGPMMNQMESTGVYFTAQEGLPQLPAMPGTLVEDVDTTAPLMIGEFKHEDGRMFAMIVNLSLERSVRVTPKRGGEAIKGRVISVVDGKAREINYKFGLWLTAGEGVLIELD